MNLLWAIGGFVLLAAVVIGGLAAVALRWGRQLVELKQHPVHVTGSVIARVTRQSRGGAAPSRYLRDQYLDGHGRRHRRKALVTPDQWESHHEGGPIAVTYSERHPAISAPTFLITLVSRDEGPDRSATSG